MHEHPHVVTALEYVKAFVEAAERVLEGVIGEAPVKTEPVLMTSPTFSLQNVNVTLEVTGDVKGQVNFSMEMGMALHMASAMMMRPVEALDDMAISAIQELANMITGHACMILTDQDLVLDITTPLLLIGQDLSITWHKAQAMTVPLTLSSGTITVTGGVFPQN